MTEEQKVDRIERYLDNKLSEEEKTAFEKELAADQVLQNEVTLHRKAAMAIRYAQRKDLKNRLQRIDEQTNRKPRRRVLRYLAIAASVLVVVAAGVILFNLPNDSTDNRMSMSIEELAQDFFSPATTSQIRGDADDKRTFSIRLEEADQFFSNGDFTEAAKSYEQLAKESHPQSQKAEWNMALARMAAGDSRYSEDLDRIADDPSHMFYDKAADLIEVLESR